MTLRFFITMTICCWGLTAWGQSVVRGRVVQDTIPLAGAHVLNMTNHTVATTDANGYFSINARENSTLKISFVGMTTTFHKVTKKDFGFGGLLIAMKEDINELEGVEVSKYRKISAQDLGILQHTTKERTFAEKRLYATKGIGIVSILSTLSGQKKILKKIVANEKNMQVALYLREHLSEFLKKELKITDEEIEILTYYVMEEPEIHTLVGRKEDQQLGFLLLEYWRKYKLMVQTEEAKP